MSETREEAVAQLEGLRERVINAGGTAQIFLGCYDPLIDFRLPTGQEAMIDWIGPSEWEVDTFGGPGAWSSCTTLAACLEWLEGKA